VTHSGEAQIKRQQLAWAREAELLTDDDGYCHAPEANLPWLTEKTRSNFAAADGNEFGGVGRRAKIAALHSSSALAVNFFDYWSVRNAEPLRRALASATVIESVAFEQKYATGVGSRRPNLDVVLALRGNGLLAIESKYFAGGTGKWTSRGLVGAQRAASEFRAGRVYKYLDAAQLLKHMLGLAATEREWSLLLLWYAPSAEMEKEMAKEAEEFRASLGPDAGRFAEMSYQLLWRRLEPLLTDEHRKYREYMKRRYFCGSEV
jgi:hypothetical protein